MAPCNSYTQPGRRYVGPSDAIPDRTQPTPDRPRGPTSSTTPQPSGPPDDGSTPNIGESPDDRRDSQRGPRPNELLHIGGWACDNSD
ncbi:hypothetical protein TWF173_008123 [Orbilia oligospora]|nr:hypothetical protein TWF173_008123 [Orbilia oligospora]